MGTSETPTDGPSNLLSVSEGPETQVATVQIETGNGQRATMKDIADQVGVSVATVSRVLNGRPDVSKKTRELVLQALRDWGPVPGGARNSRGIGAARTGLVGVTTPLQ